MESTEQQKLIQRVFRRSSFILSMTFIVMFISSIVDGVIISYMLGSASMAAFQLISPLLLLVLMANQIFIGGNKNLCAAKLGIGKIKEAEELFSSALTVLFVIGAVSTFVFLAFHEQLATILGASGDMAILRHDVIGYITGYAPGLIFFCVAPALSDRLYFSGKQKVIIIPLIVQTLVDIAGNITSVIVFNAGMFGIGFATALSYICSFVALLIIDRYSEPAFKFSLKRFNFRSAAKIFVNGLPESSTYCFAALQYYFLNLILIQVGTSFDLAILSYSGLLVNFLLPFMLSVSTSTFTLAGIFNEDNDRNSLKNLAYVSIKDSFIINVFVSIVAFLLLPYAVRLLGLTNKEIQLTIFAMNILLISFPFRAMNNSITKYFYGIGFLKITYVISFFEEFFVMCVFAYILGSSFGTTGVWISYPVSEILILALIAACIVFKFLQFIPPENTDEKIFDGSARNIEEMLKISEEAGKFCIDNGASDKEARNISLAIEELGKNLIKWGFKNRNLTADIRVIKREGWILRFRDDCRAFNPKDWLEVHKEKNPEHNGIRLICSIAKDINYFSVMGFNNLIIKF